MADLYTYYYSVLLTKFVIMKTTLLRRFIANVIDWSLEVVEDLKDNAGAHYLRLTVLDADVSPRVADENDKQVVCIFKDFSKEQIAEFKEEIAQKAKFFLSSITLEEWLVETGFDFCHLYPEDKVIKKTGQIIKKGDKVKLPSGDIKYVDTIKVTIVNDTKLKVSENPETVGLGIVKNTELCYVKPVKAGEAIEADTLGD